jgi:hypothetical protein
VPKPGADAAKDTRQADYGHREMVVSQRCDEEILLAERESVAIPSHFRPPKLILRTELSFL